MPTGAKKQTAMIHRARTNSRTSSGKCGQTTPQSSHHQIPLYKTQPHTHTQAGNEHTAKTNLYSCTALYSTRI